MLFLYDLVLGVHVALHQQLLIEGILQLGHPRDHFHVSLDVYSSILLPCSIDVVVCVLRACRCLHMSDVSNTKVNLLSTGRMRTLGQSDDVLCMIWHRVVFQIPWHDPIARVKCMCHMSVALVILVRIVHSMVWCILDSV